MAAVTGVSPFFGQDDPDIKREPQGSEPPCSATSPKLTNQIHLFLCRGTEKPQCFSVGGVFPLGNMKPGEMKSPAKTHVRIFPGLDRNCLWHCDLVIRLAVGATPPISGPVLRITSKAHPQQKIKAVCIWCVVPQGSSDALCCFGALGTSEQQWWQGERGWCSSGPLTFPPSNQHLLG